MTDLQPLLSSPVAENIRVRIRQRDDQTLSDQREITAIPAPSGQESARATFLRDRLRAVGLEPAEDEVGNVIAAYGPAPSAEGSGPVVVASHLDTVFPEHTDLTVRNGGARLMAPGIADNSRGVAAMLALADVFVRERVQLSRPVVFVGTVGEEGLGDLRGVKHLFRDASPMRAASSFIALDGPGRERIVHRAVGSLRLRITFRGPGGHSWGDRGTANPIHAAAMAIEELRELPGGADDITATVARFGGGTSVNAIPQEAWLELDLRTSGAGALEELEREAHAIVAEAVEVESARATRGPGLTAEVERIGYRPSGVTDRDSHIVATAVAVTELLGGTPELAASSTDANVPISLGIPAIAIGAGGVGGRTHTIDEWYQNEKGALGIERAALIILALAGAAPQP